MNSTIDIERYSEKFTDLHYTLNSKLKKRCGMLSKKVKQKILPKIRRSLSTTYGSRYFAEPIPKYEIPENPMTPEAAYQIISDELSLDGNPVLNPASFATTWMEPETRQLVLDTINKNFIDQDEYPQTKKIHDRIITMLSHLFNVPEDCCSIGTATVGSSEAIMLGLLAHKWTWKKRRKAKAKSFDKPNIVFGSDVHSCWEKFALYFDVEMRIAPMKKNAYILTAEDVATRIDEKTIAVGTVLGTTFTGQMDAIKDINDLLSRDKEKMEWDIPIHVDAASGGFIAPFVYPEVEWDFRLPQIKSINVSNHKFGLVYPGMIEVFKPDPNKAENILVIATDSNLVFARAIVTHTSRWYSSLLEEITCNVITYPLPDVEGECEVRVTPPAVIDTCGKLITATTTNPTTYSSQGIYTVTWIYYDYLHTTQTQRVIVSDTKPPIPDADPLPDIFAESEITLTPPTAIDNCSGSIKATTTDPTTYFNPGTYTLTWSYDDDHGNYT